MTRPAPLTPADCDLRDFQFMPLDVVRLTQSDLVAFEDPAAVVANMLLWCASWHQVPAASLTNDDRTLARLAGYGRGGSEWDKVRDGAKRGWIECSDGRLYHPVVAEKARESFAKKLAQRHRTYLAAVRKHNERNPQDKRDGLNYEGWLAAGRPRDVVNTAPRQAEEPDLLDRVTRDTPPKSRVTDDNVTRDRGDMSRDQEGNVARDKATKGEGREREGTVKGDYIDKQQPLDSTKARDDVATPKIDPFDLTASADRFARLAGIPHTQPGSIAQNVTVIREWNTDGIDLDTVLVPIIERFRLDKPDQRISTLRFFDQSVRAAVAAAEVKRGKSGGYVAKPGKAVDPLKAKDEDATPVRQARKGFAKIPDLAPDRIALSLGNDGSTLVVTARSQFIAAKVRSDHWNAVNDAARSAGLIDVEVRTQ